MFFEQFFNLELIQYFDDNCLDYNLLDLKFYKFTGFENHSHFYIYRDRVRFDKGSIKYFNEDHNLFSNLKSLYKSKFVIYLEENNLIQHETVEFQYTML